MTIKNVLIPLACLALLFSCKSERKVTAYEELYKEQPVSIITAPVQDNAPRPPVKTTQDEVFNDEYKAAAVYLRQCLAAPLAAQGYYTVAPLTSDVILEKVGKDYRQLQLDGIKEMHTLYGIDAVLLVAIHKWQRPEINEVVVFAEYTLRSTKSGLELMHTWVRGNKIQPVDVKGEPAELPGDLAFMERNKMDSRLAHMCILVQQMTDFAMRNIPTSVSRWHFQHDQYIPSNPAFYSFTINPDGSIERSKYSEDAFGNECFTD